MSQDVSQISLGSAQQISSAKSTAVATQLVQPQALPLPDKNQSKAPQTGDSVVIDAVPSVQNGRLQRIEDGVADKRNIAARVRETDIALDIAGSHVQAMKANLAKIVKNYPPFSIDSKERMEILRSYVSLRKEIDSMTIPAPLPQPGVQLSSKIWQDKGLAGILPGELAPTATDAQVHSAHEQLGNAAQAISEGKQELQRIF